MYSVVDYAIKWMKNEKKRSLIRFQNELKLLGHGFKFESETLFIIYDKYVVVPADRTPNTIDLIY